MVNSGWWRSRSSTFWLGDTPAKARSSVAAEIPALRASARSSFRKPGKLSDGVAKARTAKAADNALANRTRRVGMARFLPCRTEPEQLESVDSRKLEVCVVRGGRGLGPFQRGGALPPVIVGDRRSRREGAVTDVEEHHQRRSADIGADRRDQIPPGKRIRIIRVAPRHAGQTEEVLREEGQVDADKRQPEMQLAPELRILVSGHLADPVVEAGEDAEHGAKGQHVVEVRDYVIGVVDDVVDAGIGQHHAGDAAD